ncbi:hypothetical protein [Micromonospora sp. HUAS LYJ1]|uniref:hypothetical protein n=1 Tax=Micromonospora sp. HUAS LYJ1 TaxID=3061626 RepID=UPI0026718A08|nr:hypothetical protein [Micromonospora sp. HUAS LYJ1]WKU07997.1 hypothetical protein Q2K16_13690 [Micromonospora sp. HUAS LYJ1]
MSYDPYNQQHDPRQLPPTPPPQVVYVQSPTSKAATVGIWVIVLWIVGPLLLVLLCCAGCIGTGLIGGITGGATPSATSSP